MPRLAARKGDAQLSHPSGSGSVNPKFAGAMASDEQGDKAINHGEFSVVLDREKGGLGMHHEISHSHLAAGDESCESCEQSQENQYAADQLNQQAQVVQGESDWNFLSAENSNL